MASSMNNPADDVASIVNRVSVPTKDHSNVDRKELDINGLSEDDFMSLHKIDPFMFYSIPGIRKACICLHEVDYSDLNALLISGPDNAQQRHGQAGLNTKVQKSTAISFEAHPSALLEDIWNN